MSENQAYRLRCRYQVTRVALAKQLVFPLLRLPHVSSLYVSCLALESANPWPLASGSSSIQHIYLDNHGDAEPPELHYDHLHNMLAAARMLKTLTIDDGEVDCNRVLSGLRTNAASLEAILIYGSITNGFNDQFLYPIHALESFTNLKIVTLDVMDLLSEAVSRRGWELTGVNLRSNHESFSEQVGKFLQRALPISLEVLVLQQHKLLAQSDANAIDTAISHFIKERTSGVPRAALQAVFLDHLEDNMNPGPDQTSHAQRTKP